MNDFEELAQQCWDDSGKWFPFNAKMVDPGGEQISFLLLALAGEVGEAANVWKKYLRGSKDIWDVLPHLREELIDVLIYWMNLAYVLNIDVKEEYARKREFNRIRFDRNTGVGTGGPSDHRQADKEDPS